MRRCTDCPKRPFGAFISISRKLETRLDAKFAKKNEKNLKERFLGDELNFCHDDFNFGLGGQPIDRVEGSNRGSRRLLDLRSLRLQQQQSFKK